MIDIAQRLLAESEPDNADFMFRLLPGMRREDILGVRMPALRRLARELRGTLEAAAFMAALPHRYLDEDNLHAILVSDLRDFEACLAALDAFLPFVDNWATCDAIAPACFKKHTDALLPQARRWMASAHPYTCRCGIGMLMRYYLEDAFDPQQLEWVSSIPANEYYIHMMIAWYFATALAKQYDAALPYLQQRRLDRRTHNKTIQKALESYRVTDAHKAELKALRR